MKFIHLAFVFLSLLSLKVSAATTLNCLGVYDENRGSALTLTVVGTNYQLSGTSVAGDGFNASQNCVGNYLNMSRDKKYSQYSAAAPSYMADKSVCTANYIKIMPSAMTPSGGMLVLARTSGGDTHDNSGYSYRYYRCSTQK